MNHTQKLPQHMLFSEFAGLAKVTKLVNHGRSWEVFLFERSLGFCDGPTEGGAIKQAHTREVNNALYAHTAGAPECIQTELPTVQVLAEYPALRDLFPDVVHKVK